jgi:hypothetical protein
VIAKILYLRENYHFGAGRIKSYLARFHELSIATSSVHRILVRHGLDRLPANQKHRPHKQRWKRYEKPQSGHRLQVDVKFLERAKAMQQYADLLDSLRDRLRTRSRISAAQLSKPAMQVYSRRGPVIFEVEAWQTGHHRSAESQS